MARVTELRSKREREGWVRVDLYVPPGPALEALDRLSDGNPRKRTAALIKLLERA